MEVARGKLAVNYPAPRMREQGGSNFSEFSGRARPKSLIEEPAKNVYTNVFSLRPLQYNYLFLITRPASRFTARFKSQKCHYFASMNLTSDLCCNYCLVAGSVVKGRCWEIIQCHSQETIPDFFYSEFGAILHRKGWK